MSRKFGYFSVCLLLWAAGCATVPRVPQGAGALLTLEGLCQKYSVDCGWDGVSQIVTMDYQGQKVQAMVGSSTVVVGNVKLVISAPLKRRQGMVIVPPDFERLVFAPQATGTRSGLSYAGSRLGRIVVDAGHGGKDPGAIGYGKIREKDVDLDIATRVARNFRHEGIEVVLTRDSDEFISLAQRTDLASCAGTDIFISIHANATKSARARGYEVYYAAGLNALDRNDAQRVKNEKKFCRTLNMQHEIIPLRGIVADMLYAFKVSDAALLAEVVAKGLYLDLGQGSRGSKTARYFVLRNTLVPAVLVEVGFISNVREAGLLKEPVYREKVAQAIVKSVLRYVYAAGR
ncbi:MAG: N-acetylmuramoyl-L-alanine amidase [Candidatus Omnitrophota bacterium]